MELNYTDLLEQALTVPGGFSDTYCRFYDYSLLNQLLIASQLRAPEPVATYRRWAELGRQVRRGSKAKAIIRPITVKVADSSDTDTDTPKTLTRFKLVNAVFPLSDTDGPDLALPEVPRWCADAAMAALDVTTAPFQHTDGNVQGYALAEARTVHVSPVAKHPLKTLVHELSHIVLGHTASSPVCEFQAEAVAYLVLHSLDMTDAMDRAESRAYVQTWLRGHRPTDAEIRAVFTTADKIVKAGRAA